MNIIKSLIFTCKSIIIVILIISDLFVYKMKIPKKWQIPLCHSLKYWKKIEISIKNAIFSVHFKQHVMCYESFKKAIISKYNECSKNIVYVRDHSCTTGSINEIKKNTWRIEGLFFVLHHWLSKLEIWSPHIYWEENTFRIQNSFP